jgi:hypothetical protein
MEYGINDGRHKVRGQPLCVATSCAAKIRENEPLMAGQHKFGGPNLC